MRTNHLCGTLLVFLFATGPNFAQPYVTQPPAPPAPPQSFSFMMATPGKGGPYLGVGLIEIDSERAGALGMEEPHGVEISSLQPDSPADKGGLQKGDVVVQYDGQRVRGVEHFVRLVRETPVGREVKLGVLRDRSQTNLAITIGQRKRTRTETFFFCNDAKDDCEVRLPGVRFSVPRLDIDIPKPRIVMQSRYLGAELEGIDGQLAEYFGVEEGVLVRTIEANTPASRAGLQAGDVITSVDGKSVDSPGDIREAIRAADADEELRLEAIRKQKKQTLQLEARRKED